MVQPTCNAPCHGRQLARHVCLLYRLLKEMLIWAYIRDALGPYLNLRRATVYSRHCLLYVCLCVCFIAAGGFTALETERTENFVLNSAHHVPPARSLP
jgi:hypothetical protein